MVKTIFATLIVSVSVYFGFTAAGQYAQAYMGDLIGSTVWQADL